MDVPGSAFSHGLGEDRVPDGHGGTLDKALESQRAQEALVDRLLLGHAQMRLRLAEQLDQLTNELRDARHQLDRVSATLNGIQFAIMTAAGPLREVI